MQHSPLTISAYFGMSLNGCIADKAGNLAWLEKYGQEGEDYGFQQFIESVDTLLMGKGTYQHIIDHINPNDWPFDGKRVYVISNSLNKVHEKASLLAGDPVTILEEVKKHGAKHIYVDGGKLVSQFINANLIDNLTISIVPEIIPDGIMLFNNIQVPASYELQSAKPYESGLTQLIYKKRNNHD